MAVELAAVDDSEMLNLALDTLEGSLNFDWEKAYNGIYYFMDVERKPTSS